jgi:vacuolar-type H+-ATPase subunit F/Vma7
MISDRSVYLFGKESVMALSNDIARISAAQSMYDTSSYNKSVKKEEQADKTKAAENKNTPKVTGRTVGDVQLSEKAAKFYEKFKAKFPGMDFVLVSKDMKEQVEANAAAYGKANKTVVLIDDEKIERMANDEKYASKIEATIKGAEAQIKALSSGIASTGANVQGYGMKINDDGTATLFATLKNSSKAQKARIEKKAAKKKAEEKAAKKLEEKKANKKDRDRDISDKHISDKDAKVADNTNKTRDKDRIPDEDEYVTITANTADELLKKIADQAMLFRSDSVRTQEEMMVGQHFDFNI